MSAAIHGNFDVAAEISAATIITVANALIAPRVMRQQVDAGGVRGEIIPAVRVASVTFPGGAAVQFSLDTTGTVLNVAEVQIGNFPPVTLQDGRVPLDGTCGVGDSLEIAAGSLVINFAPDANGEPVVTPAFDTGRVLSSPAVMLYLAARVLQGATADQARAEIVTRINDTARQIVTDILRTIGVVTLVPASPPMVVRNFRTTPSSVEALAVIGGPGGNRSLITRSVLRSGASGVFIDRIAFVLNNTSLLRDFIRPALTGLFGLTPGGFNPTHPFRWSGSVPLAGISVPMLAASSLTFLTAGVDEFQRLHVVGIAVGTGTAGAFSISAGFDVTFGITATTDGRTLTLTPVLLGTPLVASDVSIAWWVYVGGFLTGSATLLTVLAAIDIFAGFFLNGPLSGLIAGSIAGAVPSFPVPISGPGMPPVVSSVSSVSLNQADALVQTFVSGGVMIPDIFRQHDLVITMA
jgi:hypothetical protein